jgi:opacity protein-like surface antigen
MKKLIHSLALAGSCGVGLLAMPHMAQGQNFYVTGDVGPAFSEDVKLHRFLVRTPGAEIRLDPGARLSLAGGYAFNDFFAVQVESGFIVNDIRRMGGNNRVDGALLHSPLLVDAVLRYDRADSNWVPFVGAGVGGDISVIAIDRERAPNGARVDGSGSDVVFAWQAFAGLRYKFNDRMSIGGVYKYFSAESASWDVEDSSGDISAGSQQIHSVGVDFTIKF